MIEITQDGAVIDRMDIDGSVLVKADDVTIKNSRITSTESYAVQLYSGFSNLTVEDTRIRGVGESVSAIYIQGPATFRRVHISGGADMMKATEGVLVEDSYFAGLYRQSGSHNDVVQVTTGSNYTFRRNTMLGCWQMNRSVFLFQAKDGAGGGPIDDVTIENNYLSGGGYTIHTTADDLSFTNGTVVNNRIEDGSWRFDWKRDTANVTYTANDILTS